MAFIFMSTIDREESDEHETIFVGIPSYRDPGDVALRLASTRVSYDADSTECQYTITDLFRKAKYPARVTVGVCFQWDETTDSNCMAAWPSDRSDNIKMKMFHYSEAKGPCWARYWTQQLYQGESYYLSIDSHMRFIPNWDVILIERLHKCPSPKAVLTTYPLDYQRPNILSSQWRTTHVCAKAFGEDGFLRLEGKLVSRLRDVPIPSLFWVAGFSFSTGKVINEVPYDPHLPYLFFGEESAMAVRMWCHGWDFFSPGINVVYHLWERDYRPIFRERSTDVTEYAGAIHRIKMLLGQAPVQSELLVDWDKYGIRDCVRSLAEYEAFSGVSFSSFSINKTARFGGLTENDLFETSSNKLFQMLAELGVDSVTNS